NRDGSNAEILRIPLLASRYPSHNSSLELPRGVRHPNLLITMRSGRLSRLSWKGMSKSYIGRLKVIRTSCRLENQEIKIEVVPIARLPMFSEPSRLESLDQSQRRQQPRKSEKIASLPIYTPNGEIDEEQPPNTDVLV